MPGASTQSWLPAGKRAAVCFSIDDIHPGRSAEYYDGGGDLGTGTLGHLERLLGTHPQLEVTLFTTPDWREISPVPTRPTLARVPVLNERMYQTKIRPRGELRLDRHPQFVAYLKSLPRTEIAVHGLHHVCRGPRVITEFASVSVDTAKRMLNEAIQIFEAAGLEFVRGLTPPAWVAPPALIEAMVATGFAFLASARDINTPVTPDATANMSGITGVSLVHPQWIADGRIVHIPTNFQATSSPERAIEIIEVNGVLSIKAHIVKNALGHIALDGVDEAYMSYLGELFDLLETRYGGDLWWTTMGAIAEQLHETRQP